MENKSASGSFVNKNMLIIKGLIIGFLTLILLIPTFMMMNLIMERQLRKQSVISEIGSKWGGRQVINGPVLKIPYTDYDETEIFKSGKKEILKEIKVRYAYFLPDDLHIKGKVKPEKKERGIFEIAVYDSEMKFSGTFKKLNLEALGIQPENVLWNKASVSVQMSDLKGLKNEVNFVLGGQKLNFNAGAGFKDTDKNTLLVSSSFNFVNPDGSVGFEMTLDFRGSESLAFAPIGNITSLELESPWESPSFFGASLPDRSEVGPKGFKANWKVLHLNRNFPQQFIVNDVPDFTASAFGVNLMTPNDNYQKSERSVKYAILIIALTFLSFFFSELLNKERVHPFQYLLIGLALCIFYTLLLSISEFTSFNIAYLIASMLTSGMVFLYSRGIFLSKKIPVLIGSVMTLLYGFIYVIIQLEDTALLIGSIGMFLILAATMYFSGKINWYSDEVHEPA